MLERLTNQLDFQSKALVLRAERQRVIASNIANSDTPGYAARDIDFASTLRQATGTASGGSGFRLALDAPRGASTVGNYGDAAFLPTAAIGSAGGSGELGYAVQTQPSMDGNSVDLDRERSAFADNAVHYEATLRFINGQAKTLLTAIQGQ